MKMTIDRLKLIAAIKAKQAELDKQKEKEDKDTEDARKKYLKVYIAEAESYLADVKAGRYDPKYGPNHSRFFNSHSWPQKYNTVTKDFNYLIQQLELSEDKTLTLDDRSDYFEFLRK